MSLIEIVPRSAWGAPERTGVRPLPRPCDWLTVHHGGMVNLPQAPYDDDLASLLRWGRDTGRLWEYNYVLTRAGGVAYELGGEFQAAHSAGENDEAYGVLLLSNYDKDTLSDATLDAFRRLVAELQDRGHLVVDRMRITPHQKMPGAATGCPGTGVIARWSELTRPWVRHIDTTPFEEEDMANYIWRDTRYWDEFLVSPDGAIPVSGKVRDALVAKGVPRVEEEHEQTLVEILRRLGRDRGSLTPAA